MVKDEDQRSVADAGKICLTNFMVSLWLFYAIYIVDIVDLHYVK